MNDMTVDRVQPADRATGQTSEVLVQVPPRIQFTVAQQFRIDALVTAQALAAHRIAQIRFRDDEADAVTADSILADAERFYAWLTAPDQ